MESAAPHYLGEESGRKLASHGPRSGPCALESGVRRNRTCLCISIRPEPNLSPATRRHVSSSDAREVVGEGECPAGTGVWRDTDSEVATLACNILIADTDMGDAQTRYENLPTCLSTLGSSETAGENIS